MAKRYESMRAKGESIYLDVSDFESLIEYYLWQEENDTAAELIDLALSIHPRNDTLLLKRAAWLLQTEHPEKALALVEQLPVNEDSELMRASVYLALQRTEEALSIFKANLKEKDPDMALYCLDVSDVLLHYALYDEAMDFVDKGLTMAPKMADLYQQAAFICYLAGEKQACIPYLKRLLDEYPFDAGAWAHLGSVYLDLDQLENAAEAFEFAEAALDKPDLIVSVELGHVYGRLEKYDKAIDCYTTAYEILTGDDEKANVGRSDIAGCLAECYEHVENNDMALHWYRKALEHNPQDDRACIGIGFCLAQKKDFVQAMRYYEKAIALNPENRAAWISIAELLTDMSQYDAAIVAYRQAIQGQDEPPADLLFALANLCFQQQDYQQAMDLYQTIVNQGQILPNLSLCMALCYHMLGDAYEAERHLEMAIYQDPAAEKLYKEILKEIE